MTAHVQSYPGSCLCVHLYAPAQLSHLSIVSESTAGKAAQKLTKPESQCIILSAKVDTGLIAQDALRMPKK